jgi:hypothetical protein
MSATVQRNGKELRELCEKAIKNINQCWEEDQRDYKKEVQRRYETACLKYKHLPTWKKVFSRYPELKKVKVDKTIHETPCIYIIDEWNIFGYTNIEYKTGFSHEKFSKKVLATVKDEDTVTIELGQLKSIISWADLYA